MNELRTAMLTLLSGFASERPAALRRSFRDDYLYATDLPQTTSRETTEAFRRSAESAGWRTEEDGGWILLDRVPEKPPIGGFKGPYGPEAGCCASLLERHPEGERTNGQREKRMLMKAGEEGPDAFERCCTRLHREWAENLRKGTALPDLNTSWLKEESEHADSAYRTCGIPD